MTQSIYDVIKNTEFVTNKVKFSENCLYCQHEEVEYCRIEICPHVFEVEEENYKNLVIDFNRRVKNVYFRKRAMKTIREFNGKWFASENHRDRYYQQIRHTNLIFRDTTKEQYACLYLLTAENPLWQMCQKSVKSGQFTPNFKTIEGATGEQYALFQVAKSISQGEIYPHLMELYSEKLVTSPVFSTIVRALLIAEYGEEVLKIVD